MNQHPVGPGRGEDIAHSTEYGIGNIAGFLTWAHNVQVEVGFKIHQPEESIQHFPVLGGGAYLMVNAKRARQRRATMDILTASGRVPITERMRNAQPSPKPSAQNPRGCIRRKPTPSIA